MRVALQPCGNPAGRANFRKTVENPVDLSTRINLLSSRHQDEIINRYPPGGDARMWGVLGSMWSQWEKLSPGDLVLFLMDKKVVFSGRVGLKFENEAFAKSLWGAKETGETWELIYTLSGGQSLSIPKDELKNAMAANPDDSIMGFRVLDEDQSTRVLRDLPALANTVVGVADRGHGSDVVEEDGVAPERPATVSLGFIEGQSYSRAEDIHARFGGQQQGGIITPAAVPAIFLITGSSGKAIGYEDEWIDDSTFRYFGEGQEGPMEFVRGNRAIRDHIVDGKELHLFEKQRDSSLRYRGQFTCAGFQTQEAPDINGDAREAIVFNLTKTGTVRLDDQGDQPVSEPEFEVAVEESMDPDLDEEMFKDAKGSAPSPYRKEQKFLRDWLIPGATAECDLCRRTFAAPFLRAAHIKPRKDCSLEERLDYKNVVMRACLFGCDQLYELGWVVVESDGRIRRTAKADGALSESEYIEKHLTGNTCGAWTEGTEVNFAWHRSTNGL
jgi:5-methylcytosine-specific restriction protein A